MHEFLHVGHRWLNTVHIKEIQMKDGEVLVYLDYEHAPVKLTGPDAAQVIRFLRMREVPPSPK